MTDQTINPIRTETGTGTAGMETDTEIGIGHFFYKTRMCRGFMEGTCPVGANSCRYAHGPDDLRRPPPNWQEIVNENERRKGLASWNEDRNIIRRMNLCWDFYSGVQCAYGQSCNFLHEHPSKFKLTDVNMIPQTITDPVGDQSTAQGWKNKRYFCASFEPPPQPPAGEGGSISIGGEAQTGGEVEGWKERWMKKKPRKINGIYGDWLDGMSPPRSGQ